MLDAVAAKTMDVAVVTGAAAGAAGQGAAFLEILA
jgi:hypothetical protein